MKIEYITGNLLEGPEQVILHGANAQGRMASGIAKDIRATYPNAYIEYMKKYNTSGLILGEVIWAIDNDRIIGNLITQKYYGKDGKKYVNDDAIRSALREVNDFAKLLDDTLPRIGMPLIGAGLGGGDWKIISAIIEEESTHFQPVVYTLDGVIPE
jgi:O-acetyl-ADP-ribose deacetylase (regulator of RNase III)